MLCVTSDLIKRVYAHRSHAVDGFTKQYGCVHLVWYEQHATMPDAITREKQHKAGSRQKNLAMIEGMNPESDDCYTSLV